MIGGPARYFRHNAFEPELAQIKRIDERIDRPNSPPSSRDVSRLGFLAGRAPETRPGHACVVLPSFLGRAAVT